MSTNPNIMVFEHQVLGRYAADPQLIESLMRTIGSEGITRRHNEVRGTCPIHHGTSASNCVVWFHGGRPVWKCYSRHCGAGPLHTMVAKKLSVTHIEALNYMASSAGMPTFDGTAAVSQSTLDDIESATFTRLMSQVSAQEQVTVFPDWMLAASLQMSHVAADYYANQSDVRKRYPKDVLDKFQVGFVPGMAWWWQQSTDARTGRPKMAGWSEHRISIPIFSRDGELYGFFGRHLSNEQHLKYLALPSTSRRHTFYGIHFPETLRAIAARREVILVEGFGDVWRSRQFQCHTAIASMGTELSTQQISLLVSLGVRKVTMFYDADEGGQTSVSRMSKSLSDRFDVWNAVGPQGFDPGDALSPDHFFAPLARAVPLRGV